MNGQPASRSRLCGDRRLRKASVNAGNNLMASVTTPRCAKSNIGAFLSVLIAKDHIGAFDADAVLNGAGYPGRDIKLGTNGFAGLADLTVGADPAFLHQRPRSAELRPKNAGEIAHQLEILGALQTKPAGHDDIGEGEI